jgi:hypothetical protein
MISLEEHLMGRDKEYPLTLQLALNAARLLAAVNYIRGRYGLPLHVSSGYRPGRFNKKAGGAKNSSHLSCEADDFQDSPIITVSPETPNLGRFCLNGKPFKLGLFGKWCLEHLDELEKAGLYMEHPAYTIGWVHLTTRSPDSGNRVFIPDQRKLA